MNEKTKLILAKRAVEDIENFSSAAHRLLEGSAGLYLPGLDERIEQLTLEVYELRKRLRDDCLIEPNQDPGPERE